MASRSSGRLKTGIVLFFLIFFGSSLEAQMTAVIDTSAHKPGGIEGYLMNAVSGKPVEGVAVEVVGSATVGRSGPDGAFRVRNLFPGTHSLRILADGFRPICVAEVAVQPGRTVHLRPIDLRPVSFTGVETLATLYINAKQLVTGTDDYGLGLVPLAQLVVVSSQDPKVEEAVASRPDLDRKDLELLPQKGEDLYRAMARLPGMATSDTSTRFWVRGAPSDQMLIRFNGVDLIEPFHFKGFDEASSIVDLETLESLELVTGTFSAKYGDRIAGALTLETEHFDPLQPHTAVGTSFTGDKVLNRGDFARGKGNWLVEARRGRPGRVVDLAYLGEGEMETTYHDIFGKIEFRPQPEQVVSLQFLHSRDTLGLFEFDSPDLASGYNSKNVWGRWQGKVGEGIQAESVVSYSFNSWRNNEAGYLGNAYSVLLADHRDLTCVGLRQNLTAVLSDRVLVESGFEFKSEESDYRYFLNRDSSLLLANTGFTDPGNLSIDNQRHVAGQSWGAFIAPRWVVARRLTIEPSIRLDYRDYTRDSNVSPRLNASWVLGRTTFRAAWGLYYQSQGLEQLDIEREGSAFLRAERAEHRVFSIEHQLKCGIELRADLYERKLTHIRPHWENLVTVDEAFPEMKYRMQPIIFNSGFARGIEFTARNRASRYFDWAISYTWAATKEDVGYGQTVPRPRDQPHTVAVDLSFTPTPKWRFSAAWQYHTGWPTTNAQFVETQVGNNNVGFVLIPGSPYSQRLPEYHRLDLRASRLIYINRATLRIFLDVFNTYNRTNVQGYIYNPILYNPVITKKKAETQIGLTPNLGAVLEF